MTSILAGFGLLVTCFGGTAATDGQELAAAGIILLGIAMTIMVAMLHDAALTREDLMADLADDDEDGEGQGPA